MCNLVLPAAEYPFLWISLFFKYLFLVFMSDSFDPKKITSENTNDSSYTARTAVQSNAL